jgi:hypothetical protein
MESVRVKILAVALFMSAACGLQSATITIVNKDGPNEGLNDPTLAAPVGGNTGTTIGQQRVLVFQRAAEIWGAALVSGVPVRVAVQFDPLSCTPSQGVLGSAGPIFVIRDFAGAPRPATYYVSALANAFAGEDLDPTEDDISATFNSELGKAGCLANASWYYGLDNNAPPNSIDLLDTVLHEMGHGLGFLSLVNLTTGSRLNGFNDAFIYNLEDHTTGKTYPEMTDAERRTANANTGNLHWVGTNTVARSGILSSGRGPGGHVEMYAPSPIEAGSSVSHFSTSLVPDELMEPFATPTSDRRLTTETFKDIGWTVLPPTPSIAASGAAIQSEGCGQPNGVVDPNETVSVNLSLRNTGTAAASNVVATLLASGGVTSPSAPQNYGTLLPSVAPTSRTFSFAANGGCGGILSATLQLQSGTNSLGTAVFNFNLGSRRSFTNATAINLPLSGPGAPYPSTITVSGVAQAVSGVSVKMFNVQHANPDDLDLLLVGPGGQTVILMSDAGGSSDLSGANLTFDDAAPGSLPDSSQIASGTFRPTNFGVDEAFASPAPGGPYGTTLSAFNGINPNGAWTLFAYDDNHPRSGAIVAGWSLTLLSCCAAGQTNSPPSITLSISPLNYLENSGKMVIDPNASVSDSDSADLNGGRLIVEITGNSTIEDALGVRHQGTGAGQIGVAGNTIAFGGAAIGTFSNGPPLAVSLTVDFTSSAATLAAVQALLRNVVFSNDSENPSQAPRAVRFTLSDGDGATGLPATRIVNVTAVNDAPVLAAIANQVIDEGDTVTLTNIAADVDSSALTFALLASPSGLSINASSGVISWTPSESQGPATNTIAVIVSDNGVPSLLATQSFSVVVREVNEAPVLTAMADRVVHEGMMIVLAGIATDVDMPANTLHYSLSHAPAGAAIDSGTGVFTWTADADETTNSVTVVVTDDGSLPLSDAKSFSITVLSAPMIESISYSGGNITLTWLSISGLTYRVQCKAEFDESPWLDLPGDVTATGSPSTKTEPLPADTQRFYRIKVLE